MKSDPYLHVVTMAMFAQGNFDTNYNPTFPPWAEFRGALSKCGREVSCDGRTTVAASIRSLCLTARACSGAVAECLRPV